MTSIFKEIKYFIQRGRYGVSDKDLWSFDQYLCSIIPGAVRHYIKAGHGCPGELHDSKEVNNECHKWDEILEEIAQGFEAAEALSSMDYYYTKENDEGLFAYHRDEEKQKQLSKKYERGMDLFKKYFLNLWD